MPKGSLTYRDGDFADLVEEAVITSTGLIFYDEPNVYLRTQ